MSADPPPPVALDRLCDDIPNGLLYQAVGRPGEPIRFTYVSAGVERLFGVTPAQVIADPAAYLATVLDDDRPILLAAAERASRTGAAMDCVFRQRTAAGDVRWAHLQASAHRQPDGTFVWNGAVFDVTDRVTAEARLAESEERFRAFMDHSPAVGWMKDEDGRYVYLSARLEARLGRADVVGQTDDDLWPPEVAQQFRENDRAALAGGPVTTIETSPGPDGTETRWWSFKFPFTDAAGRRFVGGMAIDVTERERVRAELHRRNEELQAALAEVRRLEESLVTMCAWTRRVRVDGRWVSVEEYLRDRFGVRVSHGISEDAARLVLAESGR